MDALGYLLDGFAVALQPQHLMFSLIGCALGMLVGILPGVGPAAGTAILIPLTASLSPTGAIIMLAAIYYGAMYGGTITSVLLNLPGEAASAVTCIEGYEMARRGRAGEALAISAIGSFIGGCAATLGLALLAIPLSRVALTFGPPEFFALMAVGLALVIALTSQSIVLALMSAILGMLFSQVGIDPVMGVPRFTFGQMELLDGVGIVSVVMGLFGVAEILVSVADRQRPPTVSSTGVIGVGIQDLRATAGAISRGAGIGFLLGLVPGVGAIVPSYLSYAVEKNLSKTPEQFGKGAIAGVAGPETANNAYANAAFIPLFTLGIPGAATTAILMGALMMNGLTPGPALFVERPQFVWAVIASFFLGNAILLVMSLPMIPVWIRVLRLPHAFLVVTVLCLCVVGAYSMRGSVFDVGLMIGFGLFGFGCRKLGIPLAPMVLTLVLAPLMERSLRQSLEMSQGSLSILIERPLALGLLLTALLVLWLSTRSALRAVRGGDSSM